MNEQLAHILSAFPTDGASVSCERYGCGHINETYLAVTEHSHRYILQKINDHDVRSQSKVRGANFISVFFRCISRNGSAVDQGPHGAKTGEDHPPISEKTSSQTVSATLGQTTPLMRLESFQGSRTAFALINKKAI